MCDIKLTVLGSPGAGKSALIVRFLTGRYISEYASDSECVYTKQMTVDGRMTSLEIHDPCPQVSKTKLPMSEELGRADGFLVVYDISRLSSFVFAKNLICNLREANVRMCRRDTEAGLFLIGNKQDLCHMREVSWEEGQKAALEQRCHYYELSAAEQCQEVNAMFTAIVRTIFLQNKMKDKRRPSGSMAKLISNVFGKRRKSV
ncbi:PREDICTED: ras-related and estrogen-regulated growth inhibitor-like protein [Nanorana parkeri]|uniref:ras-related and estrogen-regulated growth inhibitor-like protein n=1 Tax=Nanorana parkeri TaxID=125878 RepID=UPI0008545BF1|nr:PREDICTED: ras-related and estrogen-regulated growth inhibitor-like protein [Nanorana parkeri]